MSGPTMLEPEGLAKPGGQYSHVSKVTGGTLLFVAGQVALDEEGNLVGEGDVGAQTRQVYRNIEAALRAGGATWGNVARFNTYLARAEDIPSFREIRTELFAELYPDGGYPPNALVVVDSLVRPELLLEVDTIAAV
jgi:enamine deaminase RidA (YjgF/YER057c/UK114 family)